MSGNISHFEMLNVESKLFRTREMKHYFNSFIVHAGMSNEEANKNLQQVV